MTTIKLLVDLDAEYQKVATEVPAEMQTGFCRYKGEEFPPDPSALKFNITDPRHNLPAVYEIIDIPECIDPQDAIELLLIAPIKPLQKKHTVTFDELISNKVIGKSRLSMDSQEILHHLIRRFKLKAPDIARMTGRHVNTVYPWISEKEENTIPASSLELLRLKLGDKELITHAATWRVLEEERLTKQKFLHDGEIIPFLELPPTEQLQIIAGAYNLKKTEVAKLTTKHINTAYAWLAEPEEDKFRKIPLCELELILLKLGEIPLKLDKKVPKKLVEIWEKRGITR